MSHRKTKFHYQRVRVPEWPPEVFPLERPHAILKHEEDGEGGSQECVPRQDFPLVRVLDGDHKQGKIDHLDDVGDDDAEYRRVDLWAEKGEELTLRLVRVSISSGPVLWSEDDVSSSKVVADHNKGVADKEEEDVGCIGNLRRRM